MNRWTFLKMSLLCAILALCPFEFRKSIVKDVIKQLRAEFK